MNCLSNFRKRVGSGDVKDTRTKLIHQAKREFERSLRIDPSALDVKVTDVNEVNITEDTKTIRAIINDCSPNDPKSFDEKWFFVRNEDNVDLGCYVFWDETYWLINFREHKSVDSHKKFVMKKCNQIIKFKHEGVIYDIPVVVKNLTQYSDGMQDIVYTSMPDNKLNIIYGLNYITENIKIDNRIMLNRSSTYRVTMVEDYQYNLSYDKKDGIATAIILYSVLRSKDDKDNNIADNGVDSYPIDLHIVGEDNIIPGGRFKYSLSETLTVSWKVKYIGHKNDYIKLEISEDKCILNIKYDMDLIGESFKLISINDGDMEVEKIISVTGF